MTRKSEPAIGHESTEISVPVSVSDKAWEKSLPRCRAIAVRAATAAGAYAGQGRLEISILLAGDEEMRALNRDYREVDAPTNVLAFASGAPPPAPQAAWLLGDVVLSFDTVRRESHARGLKMADHLAHLVIHGVLHLLGYDHQSAVDAEVMERAEAEILAGLGIADPYAADENEGTSSQRKQ